MQDMFSTDPTEETYPRSSRSYASHRATSYRTGIYLSALHIRCTSSSGNRISARGVNMWQNQEMIIHTQAASAPFQVHYFALRTRRAVVYTFYDIYLVQLSCKILIGPDMKRPFGYEHPDMKRPFGYEYLRTAFRLSIGISNQS